MEYLNVALEYWLNLINNFGMGNILIYVAGAIWGIELIPQLIKTYETKNVKSISLAFFIFSLLAYSIYIVGNIILQNWNIVISHIPSLILTFWMVILLIKYRR